MAYKDPIKQKEAARRHYDLNKAKIIARAAVHKKATRTRAKAVLAEYKAAKGCVDCGEKDPVVLDFDHRDPTLKSFNVSMGAAVYSRANLMKEVEKCDVRCANCHRRITHTRRAAAVGTIAVS